MTEKRSRGANFTKDEKLTLLTIVSKYKNILESKKTDHVTWREKNDTWENIHKEFNSASPSGLYRSAETLRKLYENIKKQTRKSAAEEKLSLNKTGGGVDTVKNDETYNLALSIVNKKSVFGLDNRFDSDAQNTDPVDIENAEIVYALNDDQNNTENISVAGNCGSWKPSDLKAPICPEPQPKSSPAISASISTENVDENESQSLFSGGLTKPWLKRRRPATKTSQNQNNLSDIYKEVGEAKLKYFKAMLEDVNRRREREEEEYTQKNKEYLLRQKSLLLDIQIKEKKLKSLAYTNSSD